VVFLPSLHKLARLVRFRGRFRGQELGDGVHSFARRSNEVSREVEYNVWVAEDHQSRVWVV